MLPDKRVGVAVAYGRLVQHLWPRTPREVHVDDAEQVSACGPAGSVIVFNGSVWHGHGPNETHQSRRSIQGAYIQREEKSAVDWLGRMRPETLRRLSPIAKYLLAI